MIAKAYGIPYQRVVQVDEIDEALQAAMEHRGAFVVEFLCDPSEIVLPMVPAGGGIANMITSLKQLS